MSEAEGRQQQEQHRAHPMTSASQLTSTNAAERGNSRALDDAEIIKAGLAATKEWEAEHGAFTEEEIAWANDILDRAQRLHENPEAL